MRAVICPVCGGNGIVDEGFYRQTSGQWTSTGGTETCRSCGGKGWVRVEDDGREILRYNYPKCTVDYSNQPNYAPECYEGMYGFKQEK